MFQLGPGMDCQFLLVPTPRHLPPPDLNISTLCDTGVMQETRVLLMYFIWVVNDITLNLIIMIRGRMWWL